MRGYVVMKSDGAEETVQGSSYEVSDDGILNVWLGGSFVKTWSDGNWVAIRPTGSLLSEAWPPANLNLALEAVADALSRLGHYVHALRSSEGFESPAMNDLDSFAAEALRRVGLDPDSSGNRREIDLVRGIVQRNLGSKR